MAGLGIYGTNKISEHMILNYAANKETILLPYPTEAFDQDTRIYPLFGRLLYFKEENEDDFRIILLNMNDMLLREKQLKNKQIRVDVKDMPDINRMIKLIRTCLYSMRSKYREHAEKYTHIQNIIDEFEPIIHEHHTNLIYLCRNILLPTLSEIYPNFKPPILNLNPSSVLRKS